MARPMPEPAPVTAAMWEVRREGIVVSAFRDFAERIAGGLLG
jgi:hypothetical protein